MTKTEFLPASIMPRSATAATAPSHKVTARQATPLGMKRAGLNQSAISNPHSAIQFTHFPPSEVRMGNSSSMNCVLPIAPHILVPVALYQYLLICSPVWQPQLLTNAPLAKMRRSICFKSSSCIHAFEELSTTLL